MPCGWEGNRRSGVTLAMHHRLQWFIHLWAHGLRKGDEYPAYTAHGVWHMLPFLTVSQYASSMSNLLSGSLSNVCSVIITMDHYINCLFKFALVLFYLLSFFVLCRRSACSKDHGTTFTPLLVTHTCVCICFLSRPA